MPDDLFLERLMDINSRYNRPIISHFWIVHYKDGTALPQFDPIDYHENEYWRAFSDSKEDYVAGIMPKKKDIVKIGWYSIPEDAGMGIMKECGIPVIPLSDKFKEVRIKENDEPYLMRETIFRYAGSQPLFKYVNKYKIGRNIGMPDEELYIIEID